jgi:hypothetical protein
MVMMFVGGVGSARVILVLFLPWGTYGEPYGAGIFVPARILIVVKLLRAFSSV